MESWQQNIGQQNIDPRLLELPEQRDRDPLFTQVGGFVQDAMQVDEEHMGHGMSEGPEDVLPNTEGASDISEDMPDMLPDYMTPQVIHSTSVYRESDHPVPVTPRRAFNLTQQDSLLSPPPSFRADADIFQPGSSWQHHNPYAVLASSASDDASQQTPSGPGSRGGWLTPDSATTSQIAAARQPQSPTRILSTRPRPLLATPTSTPAYNMFGVPANTPAVHNMEAWTGGPYNVPTAMAMDTHHLAPQYARSTGRRSRATSVASTTGQGQFICDGAPNRPCGKRFSTKSAMSHHARCHKPHRVFCSICESGFYYMKDLKRHMKTHGPRDVHLVCNNRACKYHTVPFARQDHLDRHMSSCRYSQQG